MSWWVLSSFIASLSLWLVNKRWEITEEVSMNCMAYTYYITLMATCTYAWLHYPFKLLISTLLPCVDSSQQDGFMLRLICMFLGCGLPIQLLLKSLSNQYDHSLDDRFIKYRSTLWTMKYVIFYTWPNRLTHYSTWNLPIQLLLCGNKLLLTSAWQQA